MNDPYLYPDTRVLKNLLGIRDDKKLQQAESWNTFIASLKMQWREGKE